MPGGNQSDKFPLTEDYRFIMTTSSCDLQRDKFHELGRHKGLEPMLLELFIADLTMRIRNKS